MVKGNPRRDTYLHRFPKISVHIVQTYMIIGWAKTCVIYAVFQHPQSAMHRGSTSAFCPALCLIVDFSRSILTSGSQVDIRISPFVVTATADVNISMKPVVN